MKICVTGGFGFIGSNLVDNLLEFGHELLIVDNLSTGHLHNCERRNDAIWHFGNVQDEMSLKRIVEFSPEAIFHLAAQVSVRNSVSDPADDALTNILGTINIIKAAILAGSVKTIIFSSSGGAIYGDLKEGLDSVNEDAERKPDSPYGLAKLCAEEYLNHLCTPDNIRVVSLRYANVYGPRQDPHGEAGVVAIFAQRMLQHAPTMVNGSGEQTRDFVYVEDVVRANLAALTHKDVSGPINIGTGVETTINELHSKMHGITNYSRLVEHGPKKPGEQFRSCLNITRAKARLGWVPGVDLSEGLVKTVEYFKNK